MLFENHRIVQNYIVLDLDKNILPFLYDFVSPNNFEQELCWVSNLSLIVLNLIVLNWRVMLTDEAKKGWEKREKEAGLWLWINAGHSTLSGEPPGFICLCDIFPDPIKSLTTGLKCDLYFWFFIENI